MAKRHHYWSRPDRDLWVLESSVPNREHQHHTRTLRKLYAQLDAVDAEADAVRRSNPVPEHAPSSCWIIRCRLREIEDRRYVILRRIDRVQNHAD
jgi:hypothetical protein